MIDFLVKRRRYAELLVRFGLNVVPGQVVNIGAEACSRDFVIDVVDAAYAAGAKFVNVDLIDQRVLRSRVLYSGFDDYGYVPAFMGVKYKDLVDEASANLRIIGSEDPEILSDLDPKALNKIRLSQHLAIKYFYDEGIGKSKVQWTVAAAATPGWARKLFPHETEQQGVEKLWNAIFDICRVGNDNFLELWRAHDAALHARAEKLNTLKIKKLHFVGPGTDLNVYLSNKALFKGGSDVGPRGVSFEPNVPTEEVFTTPDARLTEGFVTTTRPFLVNGRLIKGLKLEFSKGVISSFSAEEGEDTFREYISSDDGAVRLGEVALVGIDSPVYKSGIVFEEILFDENAACHIAVGSAYKCCLNGGTTMTKEELQAVGCNESSVHTDMMISSEEVNVHAELFDGSSVSLITKGLWDEAFLKY
ncbi:MAG: aminopeptidase [Ignavibacteria bacterium]|nr:aminopeptidase [Ignavibacteria bacterium]